MLSNIHCRLNHQFRDNQKASMSLILGALGKLYNFGTKFELFSVIYFWFFAWIIFVWKNEEFWKIYFLTKFVPESIKMNLHTSSTPFWNEISISNLLILSNFWFFGLHCHKCGKHLCRFLCIRLITCTPTLIFSKLANLEELAVLANMALPCPIC